MASSKIKGITIEFRGDTTKLDKALKQIKSESRSVDQQLREVNRALKFNPNNTELLRQKFELLKQKVNLTEKELRDFRDAERQLKAQNVSRNSAEWMKVQREIIQAESKLKHFRTELAKVKYANITKMGEAFKTAGQNMRNAGMYSTIGAGAMVVAGKKLLDLNATQSQAETKLTEIYKTRMGATKDAAKSTMDLASALQKEGVIGDEVALSGAQQLATYASMPSTVDKLLPAMENLLVQQKGVNATAEDATGIANLFGKAMMGQTGALKKVGISFTEAQEQVLKYGTEEEKAAMLSEVVTQNVGNMNKVFAETDEGKLAQVRNTMGDIGERLGHVLLPVLGQVAGWMSDTLVPKIEQLVSYIENHPVITKAAVALAGILAVGGPLLIFFGALVSAIGTIVTAFTAMAAAETIALGPIALIIAGIAALIAAGVLLYKNWDKIKAAAAALKNFVVRIFTSLKDGVKNIFTNIKNAMVKPIEKARDLIRGIINKIKGFFSFKFKLPHIKLPHFAINPKGWHLGDLLEGVIPSLGIDWYAKGGIFNKPKVIGVGDAGPEAVVPIDKLQTMISESNSQLVAAMITAMQAMNTGANGEEYKFVINLGGTQVATEIFKLNKQGKMIMEA